MFKIARTILPFFILPLASVFGQTDSSIPLNTPNEYEFIDNDILTGINSINCEVDVEKSISLNSASDIYPDIKNVLIYWVEDNDYNLIVNQPGDSISAGESQAHFFDKNRTWVILTGELYGKKVITSKVFEFLDTMALTVKSDLCQADTIELNISDFLSRDFFKVDWGDGNIELVTPKNNKALASHPNQGSYKEIKVFGFYNRNDSETCLSAPKVIRRDIPEPVFMTDLEGLNDETEIRIRFIGELDKKYTIEGQKKGDPGWISMAEGQDGEGQIIGLDAQQQYCFRIKTENNCNLPFYSENQLCNIVIDRDVISNSSMKIKWNIPTYPDYDPESLKMERKDEINANVVLSKDFSDPLTVRYIDDGLNCGENYFYKVSVTYPPADFEGQKIPVKISTSFIEKKINDALVDAKPDHFAMTSFLPDDQNLIEFMIAFENGEYALVDNISYYASSSSLKQTYDFIKEGRETRIEIPYAKSENGQQCFKYRVKDICGITSGLSDPFCVTTITDIENDSLIWNQYLTPDDIFFPLERPLYVIEYLEGDGNQFVPVDQLFPDNNYYIGDLISNLTQPIVYFRIVMNQSIVLNSGDDFSLSVYSNIYKYYIPPEIYAPTVFTPDGIGPDITEKFSLIPRFIKSGSYKVIDRYGKTVFMGQDLSERWDGKDDKSGKPVLPGMYYYFINAVDSRDKPFNISGSVSVLK